MAQERRINVSELDFNELKANLITYMKEQPGAFEDYNFEGSAMNTVIDVLSYITHVNSVNANFAINETFLDTAQLRQSVVSHAKLLGYTPRSKNPAVAYVNIELINPSNLIDNGTYLPATIYRGTVFTTVIDSISYNLIASETTTTTIGAVEAGKYIFENIKLEQGTLVTRTYAYDPSGFESYTLSSDNVYTDSLTVDVLDSSTSTNSTTFTKSTNITNIASDSAVYFLEESRDGSYEIKFGDGIIGKSLEAGNVIQMNYLVVGADDINGASIFSLAGDINGNTNVSITTTQIASGGADAESIESIRFSAPLAFTAQNRAVTPDDYKGIIQNSWGDIDTLTVWGGEDNIPPDYGKVYVSIKPMSREVLTDAEKESITSNILKPKNVVSITPVLVDPDYTYINLEVYYKYNPNVANITEAALSEMIRTTIASYDEVNLRSFGGVFRSSNLVADIDNTSVAIISNITRISMSKNFVPTLGTETLYTFCFNQPLYHLSGKEQYITSSEFTYRGVTCKLEDYWNEEQGKYIIRIVDDNDIILNPDIGSVDTGTGDVVLSGFAPDAIVGPYDYITISCKAASNDISPMRNELLTINSASATIVGEVDTMATGGTTAGIDYTTVSS